LDDHDQTESVITIDRNSQHGSGFGIPELLHLVSKDCPKRESLSAYDICGVHCPELPAYFRTA
jgi:hypothetical protein